MVKISENYQTFEKFCFWEMWCKKVKFTVSDRKSFNIVSEMV